MVWEWLTKKRTGLDRYVVSGLGIVIAGIGLWAWNTYGGTDPDDPIVFYAKALVVLGIIGMAIPLAVMWYRKRSSDHADDPEGLHG